MVNIVEQHESFTTIAAANVSLSILLNDLSDSFYLLNILIFSLTLRFPYLFLIFSLYYNP